MIRRPPRSTHCISSAASDVYKRQADLLGHGLDTLPGRLEIGYVARVGLEAIAHVIHALQPVLNFCITGRIGRYNLEAQRCQLDADSLAETAHSSSNQCNSRPMYLSLIHISEPTRLGMISYAVFCLKKKKKQQTKQ
eukprot:TRINITY_DN3161_c0_g1_i5.p2 TRINITY_DN3161_c0_g1~~TRINITY_DN3161_c0_g1_i5.p2  ORF type:complete len:137 (-),score=21.89 TRINITY_DN3161_c0_g1_i5:21-431(-)